MILDCELCGTTFTKVSGRGAAHRVSCYTCTDKPVTRARNYRNKHLKRNYGMTLHQAKELYDSQGGQCAVCEAQLDFFCSTPTKGVPRRGFETCLDHDHTTGKVRAILCFHCNTALGHAFDSPRILSSMKQYLEKHNPDQLELPF